MFSDAQLDARGLMHRKGFPESYDRSQLLGFLSAVKSGQLKVVVPECSDAMFGGHALGSTVVDQPDILIVEGLNILQGGHTGKKGHAVSMVSDFLDFSIYVDAREDHLLAWYLQRFNKLRLGSFQQSSSFWKDCSKMSQGEADNVALSIWQNAILPNLHENIRPSRERASLILQKGRDHRVEEVLLKRI